MTAMTAPARTPELVVAAARDARTRAEAALRDVLLAAVEWTRWHAGSEPFAEQSSWPGTDKRLSIAGEGSPSLPESCVVEFGAAIGLSTEAGKALLADALELSCRLPMIFDRVQSGEVSVWRARRIAERTVVLPRAGASFADRHLVRFAHRVGVAQIERTVNEARARFAPGQHQDDALGARDNRGVWVRPEVSVGGTVRVEAELSYADAVDFDTALAREATLFARLGSVEDLDARRAAGVGSLARRQLALDLIDDKGAVVAPATTPVSLYFHFQPPESPRDDDSAQIDTGSPVIVMGNGRGHAWDLDSFLMFLEASCAKITIKPVIDLTKPVSHAGYRPTPKQVEHLYLATGQCVFPHCTRPARPPGARSRTDADHIVEWPRGQTTTANLAPLCRMHHRIKTHHGWTYRKLTPRVFVWTSPLGIKHIVNLE